MHPRRLRRAPCDIGRGYVSLARLAGGAPRRPAGADHLGDGSLAVALLVARARSQGAEAGHVGEATVVVNRVDRRVEIAAAVLVAPGGRRGAASQVAGEAGSDTHAREGRDHAGRPTAVFDDLKRTARRRLIIPAVLPVPTTRATTNVAVTPSVDPAKTSCNRHPSGAALTPIPISKAQYPPGRLRAMRAGKAVLCCMRASRDQ